MAASKRRDPDEAYNTLAAQLDELRVSLDALSLQQQTNQTALQTSLATLVAAAPAPVAPAP